MDNFLCNGCGVRCKSECSLLEHQLSKNHLNKEVMFVFLFVTY